MKMKKKKARKYISEEGESLPINGIGDEWKVVREGGIDS